MQQWSMPPRALQVVAGLIGLIALSSFTLGIVTAPQRGRLPGQADGAGAGPAIQATEATPLSQERIEGPPPPPELTPEEKAKLEAEKKAKDEAAAAAKLAAAEATPPIGAVTPTPTPATPPADSVGDLLDSVTPPPEEPIF
jgi:hypothetical protein